MIRTLEPLRTARHHAWLGALAIALSAAPPLSAQTPDPCQGRRVTALGGPHAVMRGRLTDVEELGKVLPQLEDGIRRMIAEDPSIGPGAADALLAAIREGRASERTLSRDEAMKWMVYQPQPGRLARIAPPCIDLQRDYAAFEITVEVPEPPPVPDDARCALAVVRGCERQGPTVALDLSGSSAGATVSREGETLRATGTNWTIPDPAPCSQELAFTVRAQGTPPPPRTARVYRFAIPKLCANLAYLGELPRQQIAAAAPPATCERTIAAGPCAPWAEVAVAPESTRVGEPVAVDATTWPDCRSELSAGCGESRETLALAGGTASYAPRRSCCGDPGAEIRFAATNAAGETATATTRLAVEPHAWTLRGSLAYFMPRDGELEGDVALPFDRTGRESFVIDDGLGLGLALERRFDPRWGVEVSAIAGKADTDYRIRVDDERGSESHRATFFAVTVGPNLHLNGCKGADVYVGLFAGYGGLADPRYWALGRSFVAELEGKFIWGGQIGVDVPFSPTSDWGAYGGLKYFPLDQDTTGGEIDVDPWIVQGGVSYRF